MAVRYEAPGVAIVCPSWCDVDAEQHRGELPNWDGRCIHTSTEWLEEFYLSSVTMPDGTPDPEPHIADGAPVVVMHHDKPMTPAAAEAIGSLLLALAKEARA